MIEQDISRVINERDLLRKAQHQNIIKFYDFIEDDDKFYIIMELAQEGTLTDFIVSQKGKSLNEDDILDIFSQLLLAVYNLHQNKIIHRDIKPDNIFIDINGCIKLGDLGVSKKIKSKYQETLIT